MVFALVQFPDLKLHVPKLGRCLINNFVATVDELIADDLSADLTHDLLRLHIFLHLRNA